MSVTQHESDVDLSLNWRWPVLTCHWPITDLYADIAADLSLTQHWHDDGLSMALCRTDVTTNLSHCGPQPTTVLGFGKKPLRHWHTPTPRLLMLHCVLGPHGEGTQGSTRLPATSGRCPGYAGFVYTRWLVVYTCCPAPEVTTGPPLEVTAVCTAAGQSQTRLAEVVSSKLSADYRGVYLYVNKGA